jgi:hypothetical protein
MTTPAIRAALERLVSAYAACQGQYEEIWPSLLDQPMATASAALAEPVGEGLTDEAIISQASKFLTYSDAHMGDPARWEGSDADLLAFACAVLARWGQGQ